MGFYFQLLFFSPLISILPLFPSLSSCHCNMSDQAAATSSVPQVAKPFPKFVNVEAGKTYYWCSCGESKKQPFCDGSHKGTPFKPLKYEAPASKKVLFCQCKQTKNAPMCDLTHIQVIRRMHGGKIAGCAFVGFVAASATYQYWYKQPLTKQ
jgi:CDGSH-type Zn-finger protein